MRAFVRLSRPLFLYGGVAGVALGAGLALRAGAAPAAPVYLWIQAMVTAFQLMVHFANDYFDRGGDRPGARTAWSGGSGVLAAGELPARAALIAALTCLLAGALVAAGFGLAGKPLTALLGLAILIASWGYSAPPLRLAARGWGEADAALVVAVLVPAAAYAAFTGRLDAAALGALAPAAAAMFVMMLCVEIPDAGADAAAGKRTLVVRWGPAAACGRLGPAALGAVLLLVRPALAAHGAAGLALLPAAALGAVLAGRVRRDPRPAALAFLGVAFYAAAATGLAVAYAAAG